MTSPLALQLTRLVDQISTIIVGIGHATLGHVDWGLLGALLIGSVPGIWLGAQLTRKMPEKLVRALLCTALVTAGLKVIH